MFLIFQIVIPVIMLAGVAVFACYRILSDLCTDTVPDTNSIFVYTVDEYFAELNRKYAAAREIVPVDETAMIDFADIPEIAKSPFVQDLYIHDDAVLSEFSESVLAGATVRVAVPRDVITYYGDPSGMRFMFGTPDGTATVYQDDYVVLECSPSKCSYSSLEPDCFLYYKYDSATWDQFISRLDNYLEKEDAISHVEMLITTGSRPDAINYQIELMTRYPASNYSSAEFVSVWKSDHNRRLRNEILIAAAVVVVIFFPLETILEKLKREEFEEY